MTDEKQDLTKSVVGKMIEAEVAEELAKLRSSRPSVAQTIEKLDFTTLYPKSSTAIGVSLLVGSTAAHAFKYLDTTPMYVMWGIAVAFVPGLVMWVVRLAAGLKKAKVSE